MKRIIITGAPGSGKSTLADALSRTLAGKGMRLAGILARGLWKNGLREGFDLVDLSTGIAVPLARRATAGPTETGTPYDFYPPGFEHGRKALSVETCTDADLVLVDEVGPLELRGLGWAPCLPPLLDLENPLHLWVVRERLLDQVLEAWPLTGNRVVRSDAPGGLETLASLCLSRRRKP
jgi:nucleoside-triphosphatase THEP1